MRTKLVVNMATGVQELLPYTPEEEAAADAQAAAWAAEQAAYVPTSVTPYQARKALKDAGVLPNVLALMASLPETDDARMAWEYATEIRRESAFINTLGPALGLTSGQIDDLFRAAILVV